MSLHPQPVPDIPEETACVAHAAFPKGNLYLKLRDELGTLYDDKQFTHYDDEQFTQHGTACCHGCCNKFSSPLALVAGDSKGTNSYVSFPIACSYWLTEFANSIIEGQRFKG